MAELTPTANIFKSLRGNWRIRRSLTCRPGYGLSGTLEGSASLTPRKPTALSAAAELLYAEQGELKTEGGLSLTASRKYVYRYNADEDKITVWFIKEETKDQKGKEEVESLFMDIEVDIKEHAVIGKGEHLCSRDMYWAEYQWRMPRITAANDEEDEDEDDDDDEDLQIWGVRYKVTGESRWMILPQQQSFSRYVLSFCKIRLLSRTSQVRKRIIPAIPHMSELDSHRLLLAVRSWSLKAMKSCQP